MRNSATVSGSSGFGVAMYFCAFSCSLRENISTASSPLFAKCGREKLGSTLLTIFYAKLRGTCSWKTRDDDSPLATTCVVLDSKSAYTTKDANSCFCTFIGESTFGDIGSFHMATICRMSIQQLLNSVRM